MSYESLPERLLAAEDEAWFKWTVPGNHGESQFLRYCLCMAALSGKEGGLLVKDFLVPPRKSNGGQAGEERLHEPVSNEFLDVGDFHRFLDDPTGYAARELHGVEADKASPYGCVTVPEAEWGRKIEVLEFLAGRHHVPPTLPLRILLVENNVAGLERWADHSAHVFGSLEKAWPEPGSCHPFGWLRRARWYVLSDPRDFEKIMTSPGGRSPSVNAEVWQWQGADSGGWAHTTSSKPIPWGDLDLVLQDIMLDKGKKGLTGIGLLPRYLEHCPQALVFALTGMDVETLIRSGDTEWQYLDSVIPKRRLGSLWWQYYQAFLRRFGRMFWQPWLRPAKRKRRPALGDRESLRRLFGCLRRWRLEPAILGHGQSVQEMIDHAHRHTALVWELADDVIGTVVENSQLACWRSDSDRGEYLSVPERMLFAMAVWLHDVGHRGDDFTTDSGEIRASHAGTSEYLLLRDPDAFGVDWLLGYGPRNCNPSDLLRCRNERSCTAQGRSSQELCWIRKLGLLCRHHQSNAPLDRSSLDTMSRKGKAPSAYSRVKAPEVSRARKSSQVDLEAWLDQGKPLVDWQDSQIRTLEDFDLGESKEPLLSLTGLLRMLDALQLHRDRVGSPTSIRSFQAYLSTQASYCRKELRRVEDLIRRVPPGTKAYQEELAEYARLRKYERTLNVQYVHYWRQIAVRDISVKWLWCPDGQARLRIDYQLDDWGLSLLADIKGTIPFGDGTPQPFSLTDVLNKQVRRLRDKAAHIGSWLEGDNRTPIKDLDSILSIWCTHVRHDVIWSEHASQKAESTADERPPFPPAYIRFLPAEVIFEVVTSAKASSPQPPGQEILLLEGSDFA